MKIIIITVGKVKKGPHADITDDYIKRIKHYSPIELIYVKNENEIFKKAGKSGLIIFCDEFGREMTSKEFASFIEKEQMKATKNIIFVFGPAEGFSKGIKAKADAALALSKWTMQHDLALLVLLEQLYRACTIIKGESYHK